MKATGIVRRVDDLGRVVIPREVRRTLGISEGTPMEIYTIDNGVAFLPYRSDRMADYERIKQAILNDFDWYNLPTEKIKQAFKIIESELTKFDLNNS